MLLICWEHRRIRMAPAFRLSGEQGGAPFLDVLAGIEVERSKSPVLSEGHTGGKSLIMPHR